MGDAEGSFSHASICTTLGWRKFLFPALSAAGAVAEKQQWQRFSNDAFWIGLPRRVKCERVQGRAGSPKGSPRRREDGAKDATV